MPAGNKSYPDVLLNVPWRCQRDNYSCGTISTLILLRYWGIRATLPEIRKRAGLTSETERRGTDEFAILRALRSFGLQATEMKRGGLHGLHDAISRGIPPIVYYWQRDHWFVAVGFAKGRLLVKDPNPIKTGMKPMGEELWGYTLRAFRKGWGGYAILTENPSPDLFE